MPSIYTYFTKTKNERIVGDVIRAFAISLCDKNVNLNNVSYSVETLLVCFSGKNGLYNRKTGLTRVLEE